MLGCRNYRGIHPIKKDCFFLLNGLFSREYCGGFLLWDCNAFKKDNGRERTSDPLYVRIDVSVNYSNCKGDTQKTHALTF